MNSVFMVASKWIKLGWRPKCLTRCGCGHGTLVFPMEGGPLERNHLEKLMWDVLQKHGMDHKKLSVFKPEEAPLIAQQVCNFFSKYSFAGVTLSSICPIVFWKKFLSCT